MITTVTTTTVTSLAVAASLAILVVVALLAMLLSKEIIGGTSEAAQRLNRALNVAIVPLALVFAVTVVVKVAELLG
jgi:hypothetical protein